jgi:uncharacterized protein
LWQRACDLGEIGGCAMVAARKISAEDGYKNGMPVLERACSRGHMWSCTFLAHQFMPGDGRAREAGVKPDLARALKLYEGACAVATTEGCTSGCDSLGLIYHYGQEQPSSNTRVKQDRAQAAKYYDKGCAVGCLSSCDNLANMVHVGDGIPVDMKRAATLYQKLCDKQFSPACASLSGLYETGTGVVKDTAKAKQLLKRACKLGNNEFAGCR